MLEAEPLGAGGFVSREEQTELVDCRDRGLDQDRPNVYSAAGEFEFHAGAAGQGSMAGRGPAPLLATAKCGGSRVAPDRPCDPGEQSAGSQTADQDGALDI